MNRAFRILLLGAFGFGLFSPTARALPAELNLESALQYALENAPSFDSARRTRVYRDLEYKNAVVNFLPSLDLKAVQGLQNNIPLSSNNNTATVITPNSTAPWFSSLNLGLTETFYDNGQSITGLQVADLGEKLAEISFLKSRDALSLELASEYYRYSLYSQLLEVRKQQHAILARQFATLSSQYQQGFKTREDYLRIKSQLKRSGIESISAENRRVQSAVTLQKILGFSRAAEEAPQFTPLAVQTERVESQLSLPQAPVLENTFDYRLRKVQSEINDRSVDLVKRQYWPQISLTGGITYTNGNYINSNTPVFGVNDQFNYNALLTIQYNFWDWGLRRRNVQIAEYKRDIQDNELNVTALETRASVGALMLDVSRVKQNYRLTQELLEMETETYRGLEEKYRDGKVAYIDLITELNNLLDAKVQFYTIYFDLLQNAAKYHFYEGKLYDWLIQK